MGIVVSLILIAVGAILTWGVTDTSNAINLDVVGVVLMVIGIVGLLLDMVFWSSWGPGYLRRRVVATGPAPAGYSRAVVDEPVAPRRTVVEDEVVDPGPQPP